MSGTEEDITSLPPTVARVVAVEILLAEPEALGDDVLESCLYILREKLRGGVRLSCRRFPGPGADITESFRGGASPAYHALITI